MMRVLFLLVLGIAGCSSKLQPEPKSLGIATQAALLATTGTVYVAGTQTTPDTRFKVTAFGTVPPSITCPVISEKFVVKMFGPLPTDKLVSIKHLDEKATFELTSELTPGKYQVALSNQKSGKVVDSQIIEVPLKKRYQIKFSSCGMIQ